MADDATARLIARMDEQRTRWADMPDGKRLQFRRPLETDMHRFRGGMGVEELCGHLCGWHGFTEADLLGPAIGSSDVLPFAPELAVRVVRDRAAYVAPLMDAMVQAITEHLDTKADTAKN